MKASRLAGAWLAAVLLSLAASAGSRAETPAAPPTVLQEGQSAPSFAGYAMDGRLVSLKQLLAPSRQEPTRVLVVSFFATWCKPCELGLPVIQRVVTSLEAQHVRGVLVAFQEDTGTVAPFVAKKGLSLPVVADPYVKIATRFGADRSLPWTFVLDGQGVVRKVFHKEGPAFEQELRQAILDAMR